MKRLVLLFLLFIFEGCSFKKQAKNSHIEIFYFKEGYKNISTLRCEYWKPKKEDLKYNNFYFKKLNDTIFIKEFDNYFSKLRNKNNGYDYSVHMKVIYKHGNKIDSICIGKSFGIIVNGIQKEENKDFLNLIFDEVYFKSNPGYSTSFRDKKSGSP